MKIRKLALPILIALLIFASVGYFFRGYLTDEYAPLPRRSMRDIPADSRILVIAPHSDDESLGCAGLIMKALHNHSSVKVAIITNGDGSRSSAKKMFHSKTLKPKQYIDLGRERHGESLAALKKLGVAEKNVHFLSYPDGGTYQLWSNHWESAKPYQDPFTKTDRSPYPFSFKKASLYTGEDEAADLLKILEQFQPTMVVYPHPDDHHKDHWASYAFVKYGLTKANLKQQAQELVYLVHYSGWPAPLGYHPTNWLKPPRSLLEKNYTWIQMPLSKAEQTKKQEAVKAYKSQIKNLGFFLRSFDRVNELYCRVQPTQLKSLKSQSTLTNPEGDYLLGVLQTIGGIETLQVQQKPGGLKVKVNLNRRRNPFYTYHVNLTLLDKQKQTEKVEILVHGKQVRYQYHTTPTSLKLNLNPEQTKDLVIGVNFPPNKQMASLIISASITFRNKSIDQTAWQSISLSD